MFRIYVLRNIYNIDNNNNIDETYVYNNNINMTYKLHRYTCKYYIPVLHT